MNMELDERIERLQRECRAAEDEEDRYRAAGDWWNYHDAVMRQNRLARELHEAQQERDMRRLMEMTWFTDRDAARIVALARSAGWTVEQVVTLAYEIWDEHTHSPNMEMSVADAVYLRIASGR